MLKYTEEKKPAFFAQMSPELFFESESVEDNKAKDVEIDAELDALLGEDA